MARSASLAHGQLVTDWDDRHRVRDHWIAVAILLAVTGIGYDLARSGSSPPSLFSQNVQESGVAAAARQAQPVSAVPRSEAVGTTGSAPTSPLNPGALRVDMRAAGSCWVTATNDGARVVYQLMRPGERQTFDVHASLVLRVGDPAALALSINGAPTRPFGRAGEPATVSITPENYREFLER